jgi:two-component system, LytTR family, response regulator
VLTVRELSVVIVEDEPLARRELRDLLSEIPGVAIAGEAGDGRGAVTLIEEARPDVVFLDVELPEMNGFEVLQCLKPEAIPVVIFVTAYDQYAVRAFDAQAVDYLLKPVDEMRLQAAVARARSSAAGKRRTIPLSGLRPEARRRRIVVRHRERILFLRSEEIDWIEAVGNYVKIHRGAEGYLLRETLSSIEGTLPDDFVRVQRSAIVNVSRVSQLIHEGKDAYVVVLTDGTLLPLGPKFRKNLEDALGKF